MKKRIFTEILLIIGFILMSTGATVSADGRLFIPFSYEHIYQPSQKAVIIYNSFNEEGKEDLILQVKYEQGAENFVWVVPVPYYPAVNESNAKLFLTKMRRNFSQEEMDNDLVISRVAWRGW